MTNAGQNSNYISGKTGDWEIVIGLEIHAQVLSSSKLFSGASTEFGKDPNHNVSLVDAAMPGMLPTICLLYTSPSPRDRSLSRMPSSA